MHTNHNDVEYDECVKYVNYDEYDNSHNADVDYEVLKVKFWYMDCRLGHWDMKSSRSLPSSPNLITASCCSYSWATGRMGSTVIASWTLAEVLHLP